MTFDAVTNAYGLMFCPDPQLAVSEAYRVLKTGGRFAVATWDEPSNSPFFTVITSEAAPILSLAAPDPAAPGPFRLASATLLESMLRTAGFSRSCQELFGDIRVRIRRGVRSSVQRLRLESSTRRSS